MPIYKNLDGTTRDTFTLGKEGPVAIRHNAGRVEYQDAGGTWRPLHGKKNLTGIVDRTETTMAMNGSDFEITPVGADFTIAEGGVLTVFDAAQSVTIGTEHVQTFVMFRAGTLIASSTVWDLATDVPVATVYQHGAAYAVCEERHGADRSIAWHKRAHATVGTLYSSGGAGTFGNTTFSITRSYSYDEDILLDTAGTVTACRLWYRNTGGAHMAFESNITTPYKAVTGALKYDNAGTLTSVGSAKFVCNYIYQSNDIDYPIYTIVGQSEHNTVALARNDTLPSIPGQGTKEWKLLYRVIYQNVGGTPTYIEAADYRTVNTGPGSAYTPASHQLLTERDVADAHPQSSITSLLTLSEPAADNSAGAVSVKDSGTVGEAVAFPNLLYLKSDGKWWKADADAATSMPGLRMALESKSADQACSMLIMGRVRDDDWNWTVGGAIYADTTPGALTQTKPSGTGDQQQIVGFATSADTMIFAPSPDMGEVA